MVQSPSSAADWLAASQETPRISRNPKVHYRTQKRTPPVPILGQPDPVHMPTSHLLEIHPNITHLPTPRSPQWSFHFIELRKFISAMSICIRIRESLCCEVLLTAGEAIKFFPLSLNNKRHFIRGL